MATIYESTVTVVSATGVACPGLLGRPGVGCTRRCVSRPTAAGGSWAEMEVQEGGFETPLLPYLWVLSIAGKYRSHRVLQPVSRRRAGIRVARIVRTASPFVFLSRCPLRAGCFVFGLSMGCCCCCNCFCFCFLYLILFLSFDYCSCASISLRSLVYSGSFCKRLFSTLA